MTLRARFVDSISTTPTVRLDLTVAPWRLQKTSRFDPPAVKRSRASTLLTDGAVYPASAYDDRVLELHLLMEEASTDAAATAVQDLARELDRPDGDIFEYRLPGQTNSVFFHTVRLAMESVEIVTDGRDQLITAPVIAEPFGYGLPEDLGNITVNNDPAAATNPTHFDVTGVKGDVEAPMRIRRPVTGAGSLAPGTRVLFATRRRGTIANVPYLLQAESMTQGTDTTTQPNDFAMSGAGNNFSRCTFATVATMDVRLTANEHPATPTVDAQGTYRIFGRFRTSASGIRVQIRFGGTTDPVQAAAVTQLREVEIPNTNSAEQVHDLGLLQIPAGVAARRNGPSGESLSFEGVRIELWAARDSGASDLDIDYFILVPADDRLALTDETGDWTTSADSAIVYDSFADLFYVHRSTDDAIVNNGVGVLLGSLPMLRPGGTNRIYFVDNLAPNVNGVTTTEGLELSYWPRYLSIRPAST